MSTPTIFDEAHTFTILQILSEGERPESVFRDISKEYYDSHGTLNKLVVAGIIERFTKPADRSTWYRFTNEAIGMAEHITAIGRIYGEMDIEWEVAKETLTKPKKYKGKE